MQFEISKDQVKASMQFIDLREYDTYLKEHIDGAIWISLQRIVSYPYLVLNKQQQYILYCDQGVVSSKVCRILRNEGYQVWNLMGGYSKWKEK